MRATARTANGMADLAVGPEKGTLLLAACWTKNVSSNRRPANIGTCAKPGIFMNQHVQNDAQDDARNNDTVVFHDTPAGMEDTRNRQLDMIDVARANAESAFDFARDLLSATTPSQVMELCTTHAQKQLADTGGHGAEKGEPEQLPAAYVEARPKGQEYDPITHFAVENGGGEILGTFETQVEAILWAKDAGYDAMVTHARHLSDKNNPEHWRSFI
jgi:hypothetical protein